MALEHPNPALPQTKQQVRDKERTSWRNILEKYFPKRIHGSWLAGRAGEKPLLFASPRLKALENNFARCRKIIMTFHFSKSKFGPSFWSQFSPEQAACVFPPRSGIR